MRRKDFLDLAEYGNNAWKGSYTKREIIKNASNYYSDYQWSKRNGKTTEMIRFLIDQLSYDYLSGERQVVSWLKTMLHELKIDINSNPAIALFTKNEFINRE